MIAIIHYIKHDLNGAQAIPTISENFFFSLL